MHHNTARLRPEHLDISPQQWVGYDRPIWCKYTLHVSKTRTDYIDPFSPLFLENYIWLADAIAGDVPNRALYNGRP